MYKLFSESIRIASHVVVLILPLCPHCHLHLSKSLRALNFLRASWITMIFCGPSARTWSSITRKITSIPSSSLVHSRYAHSPKNFAIPVMTKVPKRTPWMRSFVPFWNGCQGMLTIAKWNWFWSFSRNAFTLTLSFLNSPKQERWCLEANDVSLRMGRRNENDASR